MHCRFAEAGRSLLRKGESVKIPVSRDLLTVHTQGSFEKIGFGNHRAQEWERIHRSGSLEQFLPIVFALGQALGNESALDVQECAGAYALVAEARDALRLLDRAGAERAVRFLLRGAFGSIALPHIHDRDCLRLFTDPISAHSPSPVGLVLSLHRLVRDSLFQEREGRMFFLPNLFPSLVAGRCVRFSSTHGLWNFEWRKGLMRRALFSACADGEMTPLFDGVRHYRLTCGGVSLRRVNSDVPMSIQAGVVYAYDRFET